MKIRNYMHWIIATVIIFIIVALAYKEYISSMVSQILLVLTVIAFSVVQRELKGRHKRNNSN